MKLYKYDYGSKLKKFASLFCSYCGLTVECLFVCFIISMFFMLCFNKFFDSLVIKCVFIILSFVISISIVFFFS